MCGIFAATCQSPLSSQFIKGITDLIDKRGPDFQSAPHEYQSSCGTKLIFKSSVLHLKGQQIQEQPIICETTGILMFNGLIYRLGDSLINNDISDTYCLFTILRDCDSIEAMAKAIASLDGPFAFVFWSERFKSLLYGRDVFGRKSLCSLQDNKSCYPHILASSASQHKPEVGHELGGLEWVEVCCRGLHCWQFAELTSPQYTCFPWALDKIFRPTTNCRKCDDASLGQTLDLSMILPLNETIDAPAGRHSDFIVDFEAELLESIKLRATNQKLDCLRCRKIRNKQLICDHSKYSVAFSGGIDSVMLAYGLHKSIETSETIDLINVAFREDAADRISAGQAFKELISVCPGRKWRLVLCDISKEVLNEAREQYIRHLIHPCSTVVDDSLGCALWFVGRAKGRAIDSNQDLTPEYFHSFLRFNPEDMKDIYVSPASFIFVGSGIDEQLGGYSSHRKAWHSGGPSKLIEEISFQMRRLSSRNMGRDDRVISYHGRDAKLPFLDLRLVSFLNSQPLRIKMNLDEPCEIGPKKLIRLLAVRWALYGSASRVKKAMQFGTKIAKLENSKERGDDTCSRLTQTID